MNWLFLYHWSFKDVNTLHILSYLRALGDFSLHESALYMQHKSLQSILPFHLFAMLLMYRARKINEFLKQRNKKNEFSFTCISLFDYYCFNESKKDGLRRSRFEIDILYVKHYMLYSKNQSLSIKNH